ncbi:MAG TPA: glutamate mutase L, partial [Anaerolineales bacterium]|nr:glutamate mutase L [Anaerolineales bacterium]
MTTAPSESILAADIGNITTRAALFDIVHGSFRFVAAGEARSTVEPPFSYMGEGLRQALEHLKALTGRDFMDEGERLLMPARANGAGVDSFAVSASAGKPLRTVVVGLMPNLSLASAERVALSAQTAIADRFGLGDRRKYEKQIDDIINCKPELVIIAGGTDHGSQGAVLQMTDMVALACKRIREGTRPEILFVGNAALHDRVRDMFAGLCEVSTTENVRPGLDEENITPARRHLAYIYERARLSRLSGYAELAQWSGGGVTPNAVALGSLIRHISEAREGKALLGVDIGSVSTTLVASAGDDHTISVRSDLG